MKSRVLKALIFLVIHFNLMSAADHFILNRTDVVPAYYWSAGCSPTAAAMVLAYWDWDSPGGRQVGHGVVVPYYFERFWVDSFPAYGGGYYHCDGSGGSTNTIPYSLPKIAYGMETNSGGATSVGYFQHHIRDGMLGWANNPYIRIGGTNTWWPGMGNNFSGYEGFTIWNWGDIWNEIKDEIDVNRPCVWSRNGSWHGVASGGHSVAVIGYSDNGYVYYRDTWSLGYYADPYEGNGQSFADITTVEPGTNNPADIALVVPDGGEIWGGGSIHNIVWYQYGSGLDSIRIYWSTDRGYSWSLLHTNTNPQPGWHDYSWTVPNISSEDIFVKAEGWGRVGEFDYIIASEGSENRFRIFPRTITVVSPNGYEKWKKGDAYDIKWTSYNVNITENVRITLYKGQNYVCDIISSTPNDGSHSWQIPTTLADGSNYKVKISIENAPTIYDFSDENFSIVWLFAPTYLKIVGQPTTTSVTIQWQDNSDDEAGFQIARATDGVWNEDYADTFPNITEYIDTVTFLHKYHYKVRAYDSQEHCSEWSNVVEFMPGMLAGSECPTMSAFNNSAKVVMSGSNIYIVYVADQYWAPSGRPHIVYCLRSTDGGNSFIEDKLGSHGYIADYPSIALDDDAKPHVVWGAITKIGASYYRKYFYSTFNGNNWIAPQPIYGNSLDITGGLSEEHLCPPSFIIKGDSGFVAWQENYDHGGNYNGLNLTTFELSNPASTHATHGIKHGVCFMGLRAPCIGYDPGGRLVLVYATCWDPACAFGDINFIYREPNGIWSNPILIVSDPAIAGIPSLCTRYARVYIGFQHLLNNDSIACATLSWLGGNYTSPAISFIAQSEPQGQWPFSAFPNLVNENLVTWQNNDGDIYYSQRAGATWTTPENISNRPDEVSSYPHGVIFGGGSRRKLLALWTQQIGDDYYLVRDKIDLPSVCPYLDVAQSNIPEATGYNNSRRLIRDSQETLHLCFTNDNEIYHTLLQDTTWSEPVLVGTGKYPSLSLGVDNKLHSIYAYNEGSPDILEELRVSTFNDQNWSPQVPLMHTYDSYFWGVGAPSFAVDDTTGYFIFETSYGLTYHPAPGNTMPMIISFRGYALIYGEFPLASPADGQWQVLDSVPLHPIPVPIDTTMYEDSVVAKLISPSITLDPEAVVHILWEGFGDSLYYYQIEDTVITKQTSHGVMIDYPLITMREDQIDHFWCEQEVIKHRYAWTGTEALSETKTIAECESPFSSGPYLTWTKQDGMLSHLYYGEIPGSDMIESVEIEYSTDLIAYPQILYNPQMNNEPAAIDLVWTEYSYLDSVGYIYHLNLPIKEPAPTYAFDMGTETPVPVIVQRDGYLVLGPEAFQTFDYDSTELIYHMILHSPHKKYRIRWTYYHEESDKLKLQFSVDDILHHNRWVNPGEKVTEDTWIPQACLDDNEITIKVKRLSGLEIEMHEVGGGGPQSAGVQPIKRFFFESMYPNPTKGMLKIRFNSPDERKVTVKMYDVVGRLAETIFNGKAKIGMNEFLIVPKDLAAGVYFIRLETSGYEKTEKIILLQ